MILRYVLDSILSSDGGKPATLILRSPPQRVRSLLDHRSRTFTDVRLFAQVELNQLRTNAQIAVASTESIDVVDRDEKIRQIVHGTVKLQPRQSA